jgi:hypothetical protein
MSARLDELAAHKALLLSRLRLERMQVALYAGELRGAIRPAGLIGSAIAKPAAAVALFETVAPLIGLRRVARWVRVGLVGFALLRIVRHWRSESRQSSTAPAKPPPGASEQASRM